MGGMPMLGGVRGEPALEAYTRTVVYGQPLRDAAKAMGYSHAQAARLRDAGAALVAARTSKGGPSLNFDLADLDLPRRTRTALARSELTLSAIVAGGARRLMVLRGFGPRRLLDVAVALADRGVWLDGLDECLAPIDVRGLRMRYEGAVRIKESTSAG